MGGGRDGGNGENSGRNRVILVNTVPVPGRIKRNIISSAPTDVEPDKELPQELIPRYTR